MAKLTKEDFISALKEMTILEVKELVASREYGKVLCLVLERVLLER